jgi:hypothetical protein
MEKTVKFMLLGFASMAFLAGCGSGGGGGDSSFKPAEFSNPDNITYEYKAVALEEDGISGKFSKNIASPYNKISFENYDCNKITTFLNEWGAKGSRLFDIVEVNSTKYWLFIKGKNTTYTYTHDTLYEIPDKNGYYTSTSMRYAIEQHNSYGKLYYERVQLNHNNCAFFGKDDQSNVTIEYKSISGVYHDESIDELNKHGESGYQHFASVILTNDTPLLILKRYSNTANQTFQSEYQDFAAWGKSGAVNLLSQLNEEADKGYLFTGHIRVIDLASHKVLYVDSLYTKHLLNAQKIVYEYLGYSNINDLVYQLNTVGVKGGLLSHYGSLAVYGDNLGNGYLETKTAIGYNLDCTKGACKVMY